jgi:tellurite resistance protein TerC
MVVSGTEQKDLNRSILVRGMRRVLRVHPSVDGPHFFVRKNGLLFVTPLFLALVFLELTDIVFAVDSVPAIFALTREPLIVFTSNIFAILGLRSMYFMLVGVMDRFVYIKYGLAAVLVFVGSKMVYLNHLYGGKFPILWSLSIIGVLIGTSILVSLGVSREKVRGVYTERGDTR